MQVFKHAALICTTTPSRPFEKVKAAPKCGCPQGTESNSGPQIFAVYNSHLKPSGAHIFQDNHLFHCRPPQHSTPPPKIPFFSGPTLKLWDSALCFGMMRDDEGGCGELQDIVEWCKTTYDDVWVTSEELCGMVREDQWDLGATMGSFEIVCHGLGCFGMWDGEWWWEWYRRDLCVTGKL